MKKKIIPVLAAMVLIIVVILFMLLGNLIDKYTPSDERQDLSEYYQMPSEDAVAIILNNEVIDVYGKMIGGTVYLDFHTVHDKINDRFYWDSNENKLLYTTATDLICAEAESTSYYVTKESRSLNHIIVKADAATAYIAIDFVKMYSDFDYQVYTEPNRVVLTTAWGDYTVASANMDTEIRYQGGIKSPILADVTKGTEVGILEPDETWTKVITADGIIGYIKSKTLGNTSTKTLTSDYVEEEFTHIKRDFKINMGWHQVTSNSMNNTIGDVLRRSKGLNVISPTWFYLNDDYGNVYSLASRDYVDYCHQNGVEVWALVNNIENQNVNTGEVLAYTSRRENLINNLISAAIQYGFDGINVDLESLDPESGESYIQFIRELSLKCANNGLVLSVDNYVPTAYTAFYDRAEQALFADYIVIMGYDEHHAQSEQAGSVASLGFVTDGVTNTLKEVPADQVILGMPFYSRVWSLTPITDEGTTADGSDSSATYETFNLSCYSASMNEVSNLIRVNGAETVWLEEEGQNFVEYNNKGVTYRIWIEDAASLEKKLQVMQANGLAGGAFWKLGLESSAVWDTIIKYIN